MKSIGFYSRGEAVIKPKMFSKQLEAKSAVICFTEDFYLQLINSFGLHDNKDAPRLPGVIKGKQNNKTVVYQSSCGAPAAGMLFEILIASGIKRVVMLGEAGSISPNCRIGNICIPIWGIREEGTSHHYLPPNVLTKPSDNFLKIIKNGLNDIKSSEGGVWSIDAPFRETTDKVKDYAQKGVLAVEMECTALMSIAQYRNIDFAAILVITDELFNKKWVEDFNGKKVKNSRILISKKIRDIFNSF